MRRGATEKHEAIGRLGAVARLGVVERLGTVVNAWPFARLGTVAKLGMIARPESLLEVCNVQEEKDSVHYHCEVADLEMDLETVMVKVRIQSLHYRMNLMRKRDHSMDVEKVGSHRRSHHFVDLVGHGFLSLVRGD